MIALSDHQSRILQDMLGLVEQFRSGNLQYYDFVGALEGALDAGEFRNSSFVEGWYDLWTPLESLRAQRGNGVSVEEVDRYLNRLVEYLHGAKGGI